MTLPTDHKLTLELLQLEHADALFELTELNRAYLRQWLPWLDTTTAVSDTATFIETTIEQNKTGHGPQYAIFYDGNVCGVCGFHKIDKLNKVGSIGYWLAESFSGNGIISAGVKQLLEIGFTQCQLNKIEIRCAVENTKSRAIPERLGFTHEGNLRQCEWLYSRFVDHAIYSLLASESDSTD